MFFLRFVSSIELLRFLYLIFEKKKDVALNQNFKIDICIYLEIQFLIFEIFSSFGAAMVEWLRRLTRIHMFSSRPCSKPAGCDTH